MLKYGEGMPACVGLRVGAVSGMGVAGRATGAGGR